MPKRNVTTRALARLASLRLPVISDAAMGRLISTAASGNEARVLPTQLALETVNACNAACVMCPYPSMQRAKGLMSMDTFHAVLDKVRSAGAPLRLITHAGLGEPLLDRRLPERLRRERELFPNATRMIYTNASLLTRDKLVELIDAGLQSISISFNGLRKDTYERVMPLDYERTLANVHDLLAYRRATGVKLRVQMSCVPTEHCTAEEIAAFQACWAGQVDAVVIPPWINWMHQFRGEKVRRQLPCRYLWSVLLVNYDGTVIMCCEDYEQKYPLGNLRSQSMMEVFNGPIAAGQRRNQLAGDFDTPGVCKGCLETSWDATAWYWLSCAGLELAEAAYVPAPETDDPAEPGAAARADQPLQVLATTGG